jgi:ABC-type multidrug transport system ATPase subunit
MTTGPGAAHDRLMTDTIDLRPGDPAVPSHSPVAHGVAVDVLAVTRHARGRQLLHEVSFSVAPGELVALVGGSGAGKTTLLETMAGLRPPSSGAVLHDGAAMGHGAAARIGFVPQDDIIHRDLPLRRTLRYAAGLRLPAGTDAAGIAQTLDETLHDLDLADRSDVRVGSLSGGQRKRASIAVELLTRPRLLFLDEPTSGLDPSTSEDVLAVLRRLASRGVTVVFTTHDPAEIDACDRVVFLARDGNLAFEGTPTEARAYFEVDHLARIYRLLAEEALPEEWAARFAAARMERKVRAAAGPAAPVSEPPAGPLDHAPDGRGVGPLHQWLLLSRRSADVMVRNRLTLAVLLGSPALVTTMMAVLFRPGAFAPQGAEALGPVQIVFWIAFAGFFFGLTYGLLQIVGEMAVFRRERFAGLSVVAYVLSKVAVLTPLLAVVAATLLGVLRVLDRLPALGWETYAALFVTLLVESVAALALGLLASAAVADPAQATLALPMLCFPQVLFAGAIVPVGEMAAPGRLISFGMANRWAFESLGRLLPLDVETGGGTVVAYADAFSGSALIGWAVLAGSAVVLTVATMWVLHRKCRPGRP